MKLFAAATAALCVVTWGAAASAEGAAKLCDKPRQMEGFKTCADVDKAEAEGNFVLYSTDPEQGQAKLLASFNKVFPKIETNYVRLQAGALYAKVLSERQAKSYLVDVIQISDMGMILDFQKRGGFTQYISPEMAAFKPEYKSTPEGFWTWGSVIMGGIAYNPKNVAEADAPKKWEDLLDPKWKDGINVKVSNSGLQHGVWYMLKPILAKDYFKRFAEQKPRAFDSYVQQFDRLVNHQDKLIHTAQYSGYLEWKAKGAPVGLVAPADGLPATPEAWGYPNRRSASQCRAAVHRLVAFRSRPGSDGKKSLFALGAAGCGRATGRRAARKAQAADARGLGVVPQEPHRICQGMGPLHRFAVSLNGRRA